MVYPCEAAMLIGRVPPPPGPRDPPGLLREPPVIVDPLWVRRVVIPLQGYLEEGAGGGGGGRLHGPAG